MFALKKFSFIVFRVFTLYFTFRSIIGSLLRWVFNRGLNSVLLFGDSAQVETANQSTVFDHTGACFFLKGYFGSNFFYKWKFVSTCSKCYLGMISVRKKIFSSKKFSKFLMGFFEFGRIWPLVVKKRFDLENFFFLIRCKIENHC